MKFQRKFFNWICTNINFIVPTDQLAIKLEQSTKKEKKKKKILENKTMIVYCNLNAIAKYTERECSNIVSQVWEHFFLSKIKSEIFQTKANFFNFFTFVLLISVDILNWIIFTLANKFRRNHTH